MKKKLFAGLVLLFISIIAFGIISVSAEKEGVLTYSVSNGEAKITDCDTTASDDMVIPSTLGGYPVTSIGEMAFSDCSSLESVTIPDSVTSIGNSAFFKCSNLVIVTIPNSVTSIGKQVFSGCSSLVSVTIPDRVTSIGEHAFSDCSSLVSITIPNSVTGIGNGAFNGCTSFISITIPDSVTSIGNYVFEACNSLVSVTIPDTVTSIGVDAFWRCNSLTTVNITDLEAWCNIEFGNYSANPLYYAKNLYLNGNLVTDLVIPEGVTSIADYAFSNCTSLVSVTIPDSVTSIGKQAFYGCTSLISITIPGSVTSIGKQAFYDCSSLEYAVIGRGIEIIPEETFYYNSSLKCVVIPSTIKYIRNDAFNGCLNIETVFYEGSEDEWNKIIFYSRNENLTNANIVYNATKKTYKLETNCSSKLDDVTNYAIFTMPSPENDGMTLTGWYDNPSLSGEAVTFPYYGDATTLYAAWTNRTGKTFEDAFIAKSNLQQTVTISESGQMVYFKFVPSVSKVYHFYTTGSCDTYGYLYDSNKNRITYDNNSGNGYNFNISYNLTAGKTYYIGVKLNSGTGSFNFVTDDPVEYRLNEVTISDMSGNDLTEIPKSNFLATVSFTKVASEKDIVIVLAKYTESGEFCGVMYIRTKDVPNGSTMMLSIPVDNSKGDVAKLKAICLESFSSLVPVGIYKTFPAE